MNRTKTSMESQQASSKEEPISNEELSNNHCKEFIETAISFLKRPSSVSKESLWHNLIFIEISFPIEGFLFHEEFLWDRKRRSPIEIKQFAIELIKEKVIDEKRCALREGLSSFTYELLDFTAERITREILMEMYFYERFRPFELLQSGLFVSECGLNENEHFISISLDIRIKEGRYQEEIKWNILDCSFSPEDFAMQTVNDLALSREFIYKISYEIRKQIKEYVWKLFEFVGKKYQLMTTDHPPKLLKSNKRSEKKTSNKEITALNQLPSHLFDNKLSILLGKKTKRAVDDKELPSFLKKKVASIDIRNPEEEIVIIIRKADLIDYLPKEDNANPNIIRCNSKVITLSKAIFNKEENKHLSLSEGYDFDLTLQKEDRESNCRSQSETKSTSPKAKAIKLQRVPSNESVINGK